MGKKINNNFWKLNIGELLGVSSRILAAIKIHPSFQHQFLHPVPSQEEMESTHNSLAVAYNAVRNGDLTQKAVRDMHRVTLVEHYYHFGNYIEMVGRHDPAALINNGYGQVKRMSSYGSIPPTAMPVNFTLKHGVHAGTIMGSVTRLPGVNAYEVYFTDGDPSVEANWKIYDFFTKPSKMEFIGLEPGKVYYFRVRGKNSHGVSPWSSPVSLRAI